MDQHHGELKEEAELDEVEIEEYAKRGECCPCAKRYVFRVDKVRHTVHTPTITGAKILELAGKTPEKYKLYQHKRGHQPILIPPDKEVNLREPGVERFTTMARDTTDGLDLACSTLRREFTLPAGDEEFLDGLGLPWETVKDGGSHWLLIHEWKVYDGYNVETVSVALLIPPQYSDAQIDMVYFKPALTRTDGKPIKALSSQLICNETWQGWSRHRTAANPWRAGIDDVASHLALVDECLRREFGI